MRNKIAKRLLPFGKEHENPDLITSTNRYTFSGKEKQTIRDLGWLDFSARMLETEFGRWLVPDPLAEKYYSISPYVYCMNNPLRFIDPDGRDIWEMDYNGSVKWIEESKKHTMYVLNKDGDRTGQSITIKDRSIFDQLTITRDQNDYNGNYAITTNREDIFNVFKFAADNTSVEWSIDGYRTKSGNNEYFIGTSHKENSVSSSYGMEKFDELDLIVDIHSHPGDATWEGTKGASIGDMNNVINRYYRFEEAGMINTNKWFSTEGRNTVFPKHYLYHKHSRTLYHYTPWKNNIYIRQVNNGSGLYRNLGF
ncbi:MAG: hypothetical protein LBK94_07470 [Prevotellaceae bacterium]|jgi:RHS repeat-associated protein|nr:hypothetical protein [Prevotellaceae bacterium]